MIKLITVGKGKRGMNPREFSRYWYETHGPLFRDTFPQVQKYVQNHAVRFDRDKEPPVDGVAEFWFEDIASWRSFRDVYLSNRGKMIQEDEEKFMDRQTLVALLVEEKAIK